MGKLGSNRESVKQRRKEKKEQKGRVTQEKFQDKEVYVRPPVQAKNPKQVEFLKALKDYQVIVFMAPAGVGKSYLTMCEATDWFKKGNIDKILISRPAVGMGNTLGLLKGGLREKYEPYLKPLVDVVKNRYGSSFYENCINNTSIEMVALEYIRGSNIDYLAVVDEFQNCTPDEAFTMVTRVAEAGKLVLLGDPTQNDLKGKTTAIEWLRDFVKDNPELQEYICIVEATSDDIVRSGLCKAMVKAKEKLTK